MFWVEHIKLREKKREASDISVSEEMDAEAPICVVHLKVKRSENIEIIEGAALISVKYERFTDKEEENDELAREEYIDDKGLINVKDIKNEKELIHIEYDGLAGVGDINQESSKDLVKTEVFMDEDLKQERSETPDNIESKDIEGHSREENPEKRNTVKETESPNTTTSTDVSASINQAAVMTEVSKNTSRCSDTATHRGNVRVDSDNESITADTVGDRRGEHLTNKNIFDDKHIEHHSRADMKDNQKSGEGRAQECTTGVVNKHTETHTESCSLECDICQRMCTENVQLTTPLRIHTAEKLFACAICEQKFTRKSYVNIHLRTHTKEKPFECAVCRQRFTVKYHLNRHLRVHTKEKPFECAICQRRYTEKGTLNKHLRIHNKEKPYECAICRQRFTVKGHLNRHARIHTKEKPFECVLCLQRFTQKCNLDAHIRTHTKEKPFECAICQRRFNVKGTLNKHLRVHTKEKPYECAICQRRFAEKGTLNKHLRIHNKKKPFD